MKRGECAACADTGVFNRGSSHVNRGSSPALGLEVDDKDDALIAAVKVVILKIYAPAMN